MTEHKTEKDAIREAITQAIYEADSRALARDQGGPLITETVDSIMAALAPFFPPAEETR